MTRKLPPNKWISAVTAIRQTLFFIKQIGAIWFFLGVGWALLIVKYFAEKKYGGIIIAAIAYMGYATAQYFWLPFRLKILFLREKITAD